MPSSGRCPLVTATVSTLPKVLASGRAYHIKTWSEVVKQFF